MDDHERVGLLAKLEELRIEHRDLDAVIARITEAAPFDMIQMQRLKKRKLNLKDQITRLENGLIPDIIA
ncbi:YdcH family protein [Rhodospirillum sp. A1_3_36]|uniref:YdcH family protein n=1 Tax=Rhodospirillum sp. A1_3_36 TaxID=3391666 RepID=UPI0039A74D81